jgi:hypothetical protein
MTRARTLRAIARTIAIAGVGLGVVSCETMKRPVPPTTVLVRRTSVSDIALDGAQFLDALTEVAKNSTPPLRERVLLDSTGALVVVQESQLLSPGEAAGKWEKADSGFDVLIEWSLENREHTKFSFGSSLEISVSEAWTARAVADPRVTKSWKTSYTLTGPGMIPSDDERRRAAIAQTEQVIAPARGPILAEIQAFIKANATAAQAKP